MFKKKTKDKQEETPPAPPSPIPSYGGHPEIDGGVDTSGNKGGIIVKFSTGKRRFKENFAQRAGKEGADNSEFAERFQRVTELHHHVNKVRDGMKRQLDCSRALCMACADLGNACSEADVRDAQFQNTQFQLDEDLRKRLDEAIVHALESIDNKLAPFVELEKMAVNRNNLKLDYDHYVRKVRELKDRPQSDPAKVSNNEAKLTAARQRLNEATSKLYKGFGYYDAVGGRLVQPEIEMFKKAQQDFFAAASATVKGMTVRDPKDVAKEVEAAGKDGMSAPFTLPSSEYDAQAAPGGPTGLGGGAPSDASFSKDSPDRSPVSAYVPSASAPWITNPGGTSGTGGSSFAPGGSSYQSPRGAGDGGGGSGGGSSWWDKHASAADKQVTPAWDEAQTRAPSATQTKARTLFSYTAADNTELSFVEGEVLTVITQDESGWWTGEKGARKGLFPSNYVELI